MVSRSDVNLRTIFYSLEISISMTEKGLLNYELILAWVFSYIEIITKKLESMNDFDDYEFFRQGRLLSEISFYYYKIPE
jgi:secreted Zn-dependent insulinase-like peptidase